MNPARLLVFGISASATSATGCLPDPPAYDPCSDDDSRYYSVAPTGCDGHELQVLYSVERHGSTFPSQPDEAAQPTAALGGLMPLMSRLVMDDLYLYWREAVGRVRRASKTRPGESASLEVPANTMAIVGFSPDHTSLYVLTIDRNDPVRPGKSELVAVRLPDPIASEDAPESLWLSDTPVPAVFPIENGFVFVDGSNSLKRATFADADVQVIDNGPIDNFTVLANHVYYVRRGDTAIHSITLDDGVNQVLIQDSWLAYSQTQLIPTGDGIVYYTCSSGYNNCEWIRVTDVGETETIAKDIAYGSLGSVADEHAFIAVAAIVDAQFSNGPPGLYSWNLADHSRSKLAKPFAMVGALALDAQYVYISESSNDLIQLDGGGSEAVTTERLLRVRR